MKNFKSYNIFFRYRNIYIIFFIIILLFFCSQLLKIENPFLIKKTTGLLSERPKDTLSTQIEIQIPFDSVFSIQADNSILLRLVQNDCHECIDSIFNNTVRLAKSFGRERVFVLISNDFSEDDYFKFKRMYQYILPNFYRVNNAISQLDQAGHSYYFRNSRAFPNLAQDIYVIKVKEDLDHTTIYDKWIEKISKEMNY